jgi:hypothetical protein
MSAGGKSPYSAIDTTVVASPYNTIGSGGRKLVKLSNGWLVVCLRNGSTNAIFYVSKNNGVDWQVLTTTVGTDYNDVALTSAGTRVFCLATRGTMNTNFFFNFDATTAPASLSTTQNLDANQSFFQNCSLATNGAGTELHATWSSKNSTYANSFNIRYMKGSISAVDGGVTWTSLEQLTSHNTTNFDNRNPSIVVRADNTPVIIYDYTSVDTGQAIMRLSKSGASWLIASAYYISGVHKQTSPSATFVPQSVNGLANGRIWIAWQGKDAVDPNNNQLFVSYSDDGGITWTTQKLTTGTWINPVSITVNKNNKVFIVYSTGAVNTVLTKITNDGTGWSAPVTISSTSSPLYPSTLYDTALDFSEPLFVYKSGTKVGFYGTWKD